MSNKSCYGCIYLRQLDKKEQEESIEAWEEAERSGGLARLADTNPHIAECMDIESFFKGYLTGLDIVRIWNCKSYKLGKKSSLQVFEEFVSTGYYGEVLRGDFRGIQEVAAYIPKNSIKERRKVLFTAFINEKTEDLLLEIGHRNEPCTADIKFWEAFLKDLDRGEVVQQIYGLDEVCKSIKAGLKKIKRLEELKNEVS